MGANSQGRARVVQDMSENMDKYRIGLDESFAFRCRMCGRCCLDREDILLTPRDIFRAAKHLGLTPDGFVRRYCESYLGQDSRLPLIRLKPTGRQRACPLLSAQGRCIVHESKPVVCALYPLGRVYSQNMDTGEQVLSYVTAGHNCGTDARTTPRQVLETFGIPLDDEFQLLWGQTAVRLSDMMRRMSGMPQLASSARFDVLYGGLLGLLYLAYDTGEEFLPQFRKAADMADSFASGMLADPDAGA